MQSIQWIGLSPVWWIAFLAVGVGVAWLIYRNETRISSRSRALLASLRAVGMATLCFLLADLFWKVTTSETWEPAWWIVWDQSESMAPFESSRQDVWRDIQQLKGEIHHVDLQGNPLTAYTPARDSLSPILSSLARLAQQSFVGSSPRVLLISDGIVNAGISSLEMPFPVYTLGIGDTTARPDAQVKRLAVNPQVTFGNQFQLESDLQIRQMKGQTVQVQLTRDGEIVQTKTWTAATQNEFLPWIWTVSADKKGSYLYGVKIISQIPEVNASNNEARRPVEVIENKLKILILAHAPHPDIRSLKVSLQRSNQFDVEEWIIPAQGANKSPMGQNYAAVILHQLPSVAFPDAVQWISQWKSRGVPLWYILGAETHLPIWNGMQNLVGIQSGGSKQDRARGRWIGPTEDKIAASLPNLPPLSVPFGTYIASREPEIWMDQLIGTVPANRPLLLVGNKEAILTGEGLWKWRMELAESAEAVLQLDQLWIRVLQRILSPTGQARLQVLPEKPVFSRGEKVAFRMETWNKEGNLQWGTEVQLTLAPAKGRPQSYTVASSPDPFELSGLAPGRYTYQATATCDGLPQKVQGSFLIEERWLEKENTQADFALLRRIATENQGEFIPLADRKAWVDKMNDHPLPGKIQVREVRKKTLDLAWVLGLLVGIFSLEWILRKYLGLY